MLFDFYVKIFVDDKLQLGQTNLIFVSTVIVICVLFVCYSISKIIPLLSKYLHKKNKRLALTSDVVLTIGVLLVTIWAVVSAYTVCEQNQLSKQAHVTTTLVSDKQTIYPNDNNVDLILKGITLTKTQHQLDSVNLIILESWLRNIEQSKPKQIDPVYEFIYGQKRPMTVHLVKNKASKIMTLHSYQLVIDGKPIYDTHVITKNHHIYKVESVKIATAKETTTYHHISKTKTIHVLYLNLTETPETKQENQDQRDLDSFTNKLK